MKRYHTVSSISCIVFSLLFALGAWDAVEAVGYPFADNFEGGLGNWAAEAPWGETTAFYASPVSSVTDSPSTFYAASVDASLTLGSSVDLSSAARPVLRFYHRYQIEDGYDFGYVEVSTDDGTTWSAPVATYTGATATWLREQIDLSAYAGYADVRIRFRMVSDDTVVQDGWNIDDVLIAEGPADINLDTPVTVTTNSVDLTWDESLEADFAAYRIYRSNESAFDWRDATLVAEIDESSTLSHTDITVTPKSTFYYQVMVLTTSDLHSVSNEVSATTDVGMDYPFLDDGEGTGTAWSADPPWALTTENANSGSHSWSDSPGSDYGDGIASQALTLVSPIDLMGETSPVLSFNHNWTFVAGDSANVEISTDNGSSWTPLATYTNGTSDGWLRERFDLSAYTSSNEALIRFRTTTDPSVTEDGWYVDDISVAESPTVVDPPILDEITSHSMNLTWDRCDDLLFSHYAIHRSTSSDVGIKSTLVTEIFDQDTTAFSNSGLSVDTDYYYRVYAVSPYGTYSPDSTSSSTAATGGNPYPFTEDFEGSLESWNLTGDWDTTDTDQHGETYSLTDSPSTTYGLNVNSEAWTAIDLTGSAWPVLKFWDRGAFADPGDWGTVEISTNGGANWTRLYTTTGVRAGWSEQGLDLSRWKSSDNLRIRFNFIGNYTGVDDGWYFDDVTVAEHSGSMVLPFFDDMESGTGNWLVSSWAPSSDDPHGGSWVLRSTVSGFIRDYTEHAMELGGELDLSGATDPQLTYWVRGTSGDNGTFRAQVSTDGGVTWGDLPGTAIGDYINLGWTRFQASLASYLVSGVRLRLVASQGKYGGSVNLFVDDVAIEELPANVTLEPLVPHLKSIDLSWSASGLGDFDRYEVYRSTSADVTVADTLIYSSTNSEDTAYTDTGLSIGATYYYRVFVFNSREVATPSNEKSTTTVPLTFPFADSMENLDNWDTNGIWGPDGFEPIEGSSSLNDSPGDNSPTGSNSYILTAIDLTGSNWPVLRFWDRYGMANDWAWLEVSPDGSSWYRVYSATGTKSTWSEQAIDLSQWKDATNLRISFSVATGGSVVDEGWYIDQLSIDDQLQVAIPFPFYDDFETDMGNWITSSWAPSADTPHAGFTSVRSTVNGMMSTRSELAMELGGVLNLSGATNPQLTFWLRGNVGDDGGFAAQISTNGGVSWNTISGASIGQHWGGDWTRFQVSLDAYLQDGLRFRFINTNGRYGGQSNLFIDDVAIEELPAPVYLNDPVPHLKSVDLSWEESALGDFDRYEVYRSTSANVTVADDLIYSSTSSEDTSYTDTGRSIGATYYYRVFVYNSRSVATPSNERSATTVPLTFPFADSMENLDNWDSTGAWGPDGTSPYEGSFSVNDSPGDNSPTGSNSYILTAIDLTGSNWPVLRFWDRYGMANDWAWLEVSPDGSSWYRVYSATGTKSTWSEQAIDLSQWKDATNLRISFSVATGGSVVDEGWYIDQLSIDDQLPVAIPFPFYDDFETDMGNWITSSWAPSADTPHAGFTSVRSTVNGMMSTRSELAMELGGVLNLSGATNPQLTFWLRGNVGDDGGFAAQISTNGGVSWNTISGASIGQHWGGDWTRFQVSLDAYLQDGLRFRFINTNGRYGGQSNLFIDDVAIEELPEPVTLETPDQITISSMRLSWNNLNSPSFSAYALYRSQSSTVDTNSELVATITEQGTTEFVDTGLQARTTYFYKLFFIDQASVYSGSNTASATTLGVVMPFVDDFESDSGVWTVTGEWGPVVSAGIDDSSSFGDSPGDFMSNVDSWALTAVDLSGTTWPVLAFSERHEFAGHWGRVEISSNGGAGWTVLYGATQSQTEWVQRRFDLSPWRDQGQVWIRFFVDANSGVAADGWHIDDLYIGENPIEGSSGYPFFDGFEDGTGDWLTGSWTVIDDGPYEGSSAILDTVEGRIGGSELWLSYGSELDLSAASDPLLTFQIRGNFPYRTNFRVEVSTDDGLNWQELPELSLNYYWSSGSWVRMQTSLSGYLVTDLRLRFRGLGSNGGDENIFLDNIAVGEQTPGAPTLNSPVWGDDEPTIRPTLVVNNAVDYQSDILTYEFQVFDDAELTNIVADVPSVSGGSGTTSWPVDEDLQTDTQHWWRCRATDDSAHTGPWMETATFFVQIEDHPPTVPVLVGPSDGAELADLTGRLTWLESTDPDEDNGDFVAGYRVQVDDNPAFGTPEIDVADITLSTKATGAISVTLSDLEGSGALATGTLYHWRVNAKDSKGVASDWSAGPTRFVFGSDETSPTCTITSPADDATVTDTPILITGTASDDLSGIALIEISTDGGATWVQAVGAETWTHQWWPPLSSDYELSCRATDLAENEGSASPAITVHADLERTMAFAQSSATIDEDAGTYNVTLNLSAARATEVTAELVVSGSAAAGTDFDEPPQLVRFFAGQTTVVFPITISDDDQAEGNETINLALGDTNIPDVTVGAVGSLTITIVDNDVVIDPDIFADGFEDGDFSGWSTHVP